MLPAGIVTTVEAKTLPPICPTKISVASLLVTVTSKLLLIAEAMDTTPVWLSAVSPTVRGAVILSKGFVLPVTLNSSTRHVALAPVVVALGLK